MLRVGSWFVFKTGDGIKAVPLQVKAMTNNRKKVRTYRAIAGDMWIDVTKLRPATEEEIELKKRIDEEAP